MAKIIGLSINVKKIDKSKLKPHQNGAVYCNLSMDVKDELDKYGNNCSVWLGQSKEERDAKAPRVFIGNGKVVWESNPQQALAQPSDMPPISEDLPF